MAVCAVYLSGVLETSPQSLAVQWLASPAYECLARSALVGITDEDEVSTRVDKAAIEDLAGICRQLITVPHDWGVAEGDLATLGVLTPVIRRAQGNLPRRLWMDTGRNCPCACGSLSASLLA